MLNSEELINKVKSYNKFLNPETLSKAYDFAVKVHKDQKRQSGDPYVIHPVAVAKGKKQYDKRQTKKTKDWNREKARYFRRSS